MDNVDMEDSGELYNLGQDIRQLFIRKQTALLGHVYKLPKNQDTDKHWYDAAKLCKKFHISPEMFIDVMFNYIGCTSLGKYRRTLLPAHLSGSTAMNILKTYNTSRDSSGAVKSDVTDNLDMNYDIELKDYIDRQFEFLENIFQCQNNAKTKTPGVDRILYMIRMQAFCIPAWLRLIIAPDDKIVVTRFGEAALREFGKIQGLKKALEGRSGINIGNIINRINECRSNQTKKAS